MKPTRFNNEDEESLEDFEEILEDYENNTEEYQSNGCSEYDLDHLSNEDLADLLEDHGGFNHE